MSEVAASGVMGPMADASVHLLITKKHGIPEELSNYQLHDRYPRLGQCNRNSESLRAEWSGDRILVGARFSAPVQTRPGGHPVSCTAGTGFFPGVKQPGRGIDCPPPSSAELQVSYPRCVFYANEGGWVRQNTTVVGSYFIGQMMTACFGRAWPFSGYKLIIFFLLLLIVN